MPRRSEYPAWLWGVTLIVAAVVALVVVGWLGLRHQQKSVWSEAHEECQEWAERLNERMIESRSQQFRPREVVIISELPEPGLLDFDPSADEGQLNRWRRHDGLTKGGIPIGMLAGLKLLKKSPDELEAITLADEAVTLWPSFFTPRILEEIREVCEEAGLLVDHEKLQRTWREEELVREMIRASEIEGFREYRRDLLGGESSWEEVGDLSS